MIVAAWITAIATGVGALIALGAAIAGALAGFRTLNQLRADSRERSRPMMSAELRKPPYVPGTQLLAIRNYGPSVARNVQVTFDPSIPDPTPEQTAQSATPFLKRRYTEPIPVVTPGMELTNVWFFGKQAQPGGPWENFEPTPETFTVSITYEGPDGTPYSDQFPLSVDLIREHTEVSHSSAPEHQLKSIATSLNRIAKSSAASHKPS